MKKYLYGLTVIAVVATLVLGAVALPTRSADAAPAPFQGGGLLAEIPVVGALAGGGTFDGVLTVTEFAVQNGQLVVSGVLEGTATQGSVVTEITQTFTNVLASLLGNGGVCDVLFLDVGPIFLDLLGLQVDLSQITLDINAVAGQGNLLGNLLCAVAGLLDNGGPLQGLNQVLNQINRILG